MLPCKRFPIARSPIAVDYIGDKEAFYVSWQMKRNHQNLFNVVIFVSFLINEVESLYEYLVISDLIDVNGLHKPLPLIKTLLFI